MRRYRRRARLHRRLMAPDAHWLRATLLFAFYYIFHQLPYFALLNVRYAMARREAISVAYHLYREFPWRPDDDFAVHRRTFKIYPKFHESYYFMSYLFQFARFVGRYWEEKLITSTLDQEFFLCADAAT